MKSFKLLYSFLFLFSLLSMISCGGKKVLKQKALCLEGTCVIGVLVDKNNNPVTGVSITTDPDIGEFATQKDGYFQFVFPVQAEDYAGQSVQQTYELLISKLGYKTEKINLTFTGKDVDLGQIFFLKEDLDIPEADLDYDEVNLENSSNIGTIKREE